MNTFETYILGETDKTIQINTTEQHRNAATSMVKQCRNTFCIISRELDPFVYDNDEFVDAVKNMILNNRRSKIRILVFKPQRIISRGHKLIDLATSLSSFIEIRKPSKEFKEYNESLFIADNIAYIYRLNAERFEGKLNFNDRQAAKALQDVFNDMWEKAKPDPNLRRIRL